MTNVERAIKNGCAPSNGPDTNFFFSLHIVAGPCWACEYIGKSQKHVKVNRILSSSLHGVVVVVVVVLVLIERRNSGSEVSRALIIITSVANIHEEHVVLDWVSFIKWVAAYHCLLLSYNRP